MFQNSEYHLIGGDLREMGDIERQLLAAGLDFSLPTLFISECVLVYVRPDESSRVIEWAGNKFTGGSVIASYEQIHPNDPFGQTMIRNLKARGCSLLGLETYPDLPAHRDRFLSRGWSHWNGWNMNDVYRYFLDPTDLKRIERLEIFDEFEEWHMIQGHYCLSMACNDPTEGKWLSKVGLLGKEKPTQVAQKHTQVVPPKRVVE